MKLKPAFALALTGLTLAFAGCNAAPVSSTPLTADAITPEMISGAHLSADDKVIGGEKLDMGKASEITRIRYVDKEGLTQTVDLVTTKTNSNGPVFEVK